MGLTHPTDRGHMTTRTPRLLFVRHRNGSRSIIWMGRRPWTLTLCRP